MPETAAPWPGFERGVIECNSCGYSTSDELARRGRIQKCSQCAKVLYIPSGLYRNTRTSRAGASGSVWFAITDVIGARLNRLSRSKARLPIVVLILLLGVGLLFGLNQLKNQNQKLDTGPSPLSVYYNNVTYIDKQLNIAEDEYVKGVGGAPLAGDFNDRTSVNNQNRFVRNTDRVLSQVENLLTSVYSMATVVPAGAESHYTRLKAKLEERQHYYARLKDGVEKKSQDRWKEAFANADVMKNSNVSEEQALNQLQALVLQQPQPTAKP